MAANGQPQLPALTLMAMKCEVCDETNNLQKCGGCNSVWYCSRDHQMSDRSNHKEVCNKVKSSAAILLRQKTKLGQIYFENPNSVGRFWNIHETRDYMKARMEAADCLISMDRREGLRLGLDHLLDMLRLCRVDNMGVRNIVPQLYLRLGRDQECYDFLKWWDTTGTADFDWGQPDGYLNLEGEDPFEELDFFKHGAYSIHRIVSFMLLKMRMWMDLKTLRDGGGKDKLLSGIILSRPDLLEKKPEDLEEDVKKAESHVKKLMIIGNIANRHMWRGIIQPDGHLGQVTPLITAGGVEEMRMALTFNYDAWMETPGAVNVLSKLIGVPGPVKAVESSPNAVEESPKAVEASTEA